MVVLQSLKSDGSSKTRKPFFVLGLFYLSCSALLPQLSLFLYFTVNLFAKQKR